MYVNLLPDTCKKFYTAQELSINPTRTLHTTLYTALYSTLQTHRTTKATLQTLTRLSN